MDAHWGGVVNKLHPSHMFGERGLLRVGPRNATVAQTSTGAGIMLQISGLDYQAVLAGEEPPAVQTKARASTLESRSRRLQHCGMHTSCTGVVGVPVRT